MLWGVIIQRKAGVSDALMFDDVRMFKDEASANEWIGQSGRHDPTIEELYGPFLIAIN